VFGADGDFVGNHDIGAGQPRGSLIGRGVRVVLQRVREIKTQRPRGQRAAVEKNDIHGFSFGMGKAA
jgi:hypothetical protein